MEAENKHYDVAAQELAAGKLDRGLAARCYAESDGDEHKSRALYLNRRAVILRQEEEARIIAEKKKASLEKRRETLRLKRQQKEEEKRARAETRTKARYHPVENSPEQFPFSRILIIGFLILLMGLIYAAANFTH